MRRIILTTAIAGTLALAGCENMTTDQQMAVGGLTGATAGTIVARNQADQTCAVAVGDGTYRVVRC